ncbi:hypothetical protein SD70_31555 [Gordoniibacillus kamchatkensis]|uniref:Uncharacterized protein n=1 Tax=Gordoniibacillus kamchatkensis TaxID=1590651 RepID=A0ABR5A653_9BACL|nr:hypothetical protein [Paenibacillus sp. VKM B-2647]KIL36506.1 hypothetical protein SD70_31555 [Paenibacillus sp. VKM B-2647]
MKIKLQTLQSLRRWMKAAIPVTALGFQLAVPTAQAGQPGVFINDSTYFTVQDVSLSGGTGEAYLQFGLKLQNGSGTAVNMNDYGVKVSDASGHSFTAQLTGKQTAQVESGQAATFRFSSQVPAKDTLGQLQVVVFRWDMTRPDLMDELGALPVADAGTSSAVRQTVVQADEADASLPSDAAVSFQAVRTFIVHQDEQAYLYTDLLATNTGSTGFALPTALKYRFVGTQSDSYSATVVAGTDTALLPGETRKVTVKAPVPSGQPRAAAGYSLQFYSETASGVSVLGSLDVAGVTTESVIGEAEPVFGRSGVRQLAATTTNATISQQSDGTHVSAIVAVDNKGTDIAALPALSAAFQFGTAGAAVSAADTSSHPLYLAPGESSAYRFDAVLPSGLKAEDVRLALFAATASGKPASTSSSGSSGSSSSSGATSGSASSSSSSTASSSASASQADNGTAQAGASGSASSSGSASQSSGSASQSSGSAGGAAPIAVTVLTGATDGSDAFASAKAYNLGDKLPLASSTISSDLDVSLVEFHANPDESDGFRSAFAKFVVTNHGKNSVSLPSLTTGLVTDSGASYPGSRQTSASQQLMPGASYTLSYSYLLPAGVNTDRMALTVADSRSAVSEATVAVSPQPADDGNVLHVYPYTVTMNNEMLQWSYSGGTFTYKLTLDLKLERQTQVIVDGNTPSLEFDLVDGLGRTLASQTLPFTGTNQLTGGLQTVDIGSFKDVSDPLSLRVYETFPTPDGTAKRLLRTVNNP